MKMLINEGGPGSGVNFKNTSPIDMPMSPFVSVGTRKSMLDNMDYEEYDIPLKSITKVAQKNYVPDKLQRMCRNHDGVCNKPIDVLWVKGDGYHVIDGHHRYLAAKKLKIETIPARVRRKAEKTFPDYKADNPEKETALQKATRTTYDAKNPGLSNVQADQLIGFVGHAAEALDRFDIDAAYELLVGND